MFVLVLDRFRMGLAGSEGELFHSPFLEIPPDREKLGGGVMSGGMVGEGAEVTGND